ncbi:MAG: 2-C-methyl-D-erythritol 2,4-cyclodiphosphate synthase [Muribaculaceae bacterium]|nr:2-C-methyl-D-erythritol 2,4-cyclodiphosphate synthase [Muribaculaceae bacterium]
MNPRIGHGFDVHKFAPERPLVIGGITVPYEFGLLGHSDADVAIHALIDAILGAAALGDIGALFPDSDNAFKDIDSKILLKRAVQAVSEAGFIFGNADITIVAQAPKLRPYIDSMRSALAEVIGCPVSDISVKATTTEGLGFAGRKEGIAAHAVALLFNVS